MTGHTSQGYEVRGVPVHLDRYRVVFEVYDPEAVLRTSEVLGDFSLVYQGQTLYSGRAVITSLVNTGSFLLCEVALEETWLDTSLATPFGPDWPGQLDLQEFLRDWQKLYTVLPEYKICIADLQSFLADLRLWLERAELALRAAPPTARPELEQQAMARLGPQTTAAITALFEKFESVARQVEERHWPAHWAFGKRHLHPLLLAAPFVHRTFRKPLGFAGDYEMVNMMMRSPYEGPSLFAKAVNAYSLSLPPIVAHRNRLAHLRQRLGEEARRSLLRGRPARILSLGCGTAHEIQLFLSEDDLSDRLEATLVDFNQETLDQACCALSACQKAHGRSASIRFVRQSVQQILRLAVKSSRSQEQEEDNYDFIYCAGLFDYLSDSVCKSLGNHYYSRLAPEGLLLETNVDDHPSRLQMECFLEWHLIYRDSRKLRALAPERALPESVALLQEPTGVNLFLEVRKPLGR